MEPHDYCDIFCSHLESPRQYEHVGEISRLITLDNGDGLGFGRVERYRCPLMGTTTFIYHFDYLPFASHTNMFVVVGFRLAITIHHVDDLEIEDNYQ